MTLRTYQGSMAVRDTEIFAVLFPLVEPEPVVANKLLANGVNLNV
jgi:hypothetical protein